MLWHFIVHLMGADLGQAYGRWSWGDFWGGIGVSLVGVLVWLLGVYRHQTCHHSAWCWRRGRYPAAGGTFMVCWKHHPDLPAGGKRADVIARMHAGWKAGDTP